MPKKQSASRRAYIFDKFAEASSQGLGIATLDGTIVYVNPALARMLKLVNPADAEGQPMAKFYIPEDARLIFEKHIPLLLEKGEIVLEVSLVTTAGDVVPTTQTGFIMRDDRGNPEYLANIITDATEQKAAEDAIRASESRYRELVEEQTDMLIRWLPDGRQLYANNSYCTFTGKSPETILKIDRFEMIHPDDRNRVLLNLGLLTSDKPDTTDEYRLRNGDGSFIWTGWHTKALFDTSGNLRELQSVGRDITQQRQAEDALRYRSRFEKLISTLSTRFISLPPEEIDGNIEEALREISQFAGADAGYVFSFTDDLTAFGMSHLWCNDRLPLEGTKLENIATGSVPWLLNRLARQEAVVVSSVLNLPKEASAEQDIILSQGIGSLIDVPMIYQGRLVGILGFSSAQEGRPWSRDEISLLEMVGQVFTNALQRKKSDEALLKSEARYRALFEDSHDAIFLFGFSGELRDLNRATENLFGETREHILGADIRYYFADRDTERLFFTAIEKQGHASNLEVKFQRKDEQIRDCLITVNLKRPLGDEDVQYHAIVHDITEQKRIEFQLHQAQKMDAIGQLAEGITHDFSNVLTAIFGYCDMALLNLDPSDSQYEVLVDVHRQAEHAANLTRQLLAFSRHQSMEPRIVNLNAILGDMTKMLGRIIGENITLEFKPDMELGMVKIDPAQMEQVIFSLAINAKEAMPSGGKLSIGTKNALLDQAFCIQHPGLTPGEYLQVRFTDSGRGMTEDVRLQAFDPFFSTKPEGSGLGLGLSTVFGIIKQSGGHIVLTTAPGEGATFDLYLPREKVSEKQLSSAAEWARIPRGSETIMVVEDEDKVRETIVKILQVHGYHVLDARSGKDALFLYDNLEKSVDMLLLDVIMPEMNGPELRNYFKQKDPQIKTLFMSGYSEEAIVNLGALKEGTPYIQKPLKPATLVNRIRQILDSPAVS